MKKTSEALKMKRMMDTARETRVNTQEASLKDVIGDTAKNHCYV